MTARPGGHAPIAVGPRIRAYYHRQPAGEHDFFGDAVAGEGDALAIALAVAVALIVFAAQLVYINRTSVWLAP